MQKVRTRAYFEQQYGSRAKVVMTRLYIWHKQKHAAAVKHDDVNEAAHHNGMMSLINHEQKSNLF